MKNGSSAFSSSPGFAKAMTSPLSSLFTTPSVNSHFLDQLLRATMPICNYLSITVLVVSMLSVGPTTFDIKDLANVFYTDYEIGSLDSNPHSTNSVAYAYYKFWIFYLPIDWLEFKLFMFLFLGKFPKSPKLQKKNLNKFWQFLDSSMRTKSVYYGLVKCLLRVGEFHWGWKEVVRTY